MEPFVLPHIRRATVRPGLAAMAFLLLAFHAAAQRPDPEPERRDELLDGLVLEHYREAELDEPITLLRFDPVRFQLGVYTEQRHGRRRRPEEWLEDFDLLAVINASMFQPSGRSTALLIDDELVNNGYEHPAYEGYFAFGARSDRSAPFVSIGRDCNGFELRKLKRDYRFLLQNYRLLDCGRQAISWRDRRHYSIAAVGHDADGWIVWIHGAAGQSATELAHWLSAPGLGLRSALFAEGGSQAALVVDAGGQQIRRLGHHEMAAPPARSRPLPLVLGIRPLP